MRLALQLKTNAAAELGIAAVGDYDQASSDLFRLANRFVCDVSRTSWQDGGDHYASAHFGATCFRCIQQRSLHPRMVKGYKRRLRESRGRQIAALDLLGANILV